MLFFLRLLPYAIGLLNALLFFWQAKSPGSYPWLVCLAPMGVFASGFAIARKRMPAVEAFVKLLPAALAVAVCGYALLLMEGVWISAILPLLVGGISYFSLELLFLLIFLPTRYPVNGLSHLNLSLVPIVILFAQFTSVGLTIFVHASRLLPIAVCAGLASVLFFTTSYVEASAEHRRRWAALGGWIGAQLGLLGSFLPANLVFQGSLAAVVAGMALRMRRYDIAPRLGRRAVVLESAVAVILIAGMAATARWA